MTAWVLLGVGVVLTAFTGLFVAAEFSLVTLDRPELEARRERGERRLGLTIRALKRTSTHLSSAQVGITITTLLAGFAFEPSIAELLHKPFEDWGWPPQVSWAVAAVVAVVLSTLFSMLFGELIPKNFALSIPVEVARFVMPFQTGFTFLFRPVIFAVNATANGILRIFGIQAREELSAARSPQELSSLVKHSAAAGVLERDTATLLSRTLAFSELTASDVMTPRLKIASLESEQNARDVLELARRTGYSRFPVEGDDLDDVVGIVHVKYAMAVPRERRTEVPVTALMTQAMRVPETMNLDSLMSELRTRGYQFALVVDEYGGTAGIATLEDLVEELVGDVSDEHDRSRAGVIKRAADVTFPGLLRPDELSEQVGIVIPDDGPYETVGGFMMSELGRLPAVDDSVSIPEGTLTVARMDGRRIDRVRFVPHPETEGEASDD